MGAGASTKIEEFGAFGDVNAVKSLCVELEKEFDQAKFDTLKVYVSIVCFSFLGQQYHRNILSLHFCLSILG